MRLILKEKKDGIYQNAEALHDIMDHVLKQREQNNLPDTVRGRVSVTQSCATPWTAARQAPLPLGLSRQESWSGLACPPPGEASLLPGRLVMG